MTRLDFGRLCFSITPFGAWLGGALHAAKLGYNRTALAATLALVGFGLLIFG